MSIRAIALAAVLLVAFAAAADARPPAHAALGQSFKVPKKARYYLSRDSRLSIEDVRLIGPRKSKVTVPPMPAGDYKLLACTGGRCATSGRVAVAEANPERMLAFSDARQLDASDQNLASSNFLNPALCPTPVAPKRVPPLAGALDSAEKLLANAAGPSGMAKFKASPAYKSAAAAETAAAEAIVIKEPGAALAALLRAHELEPNQPRYLVGAAAILTSLDHPAEALALIQGADKLAPSRSAPMGINVQALSLNAKGVALLALGQFDEAERYLRAALEIEPLLAEARSNLSVVLMCRQKQPDAMRYLRAGLRRQTTIAPDGTLSVPPVEDQIDVTHGQHATMPTIPIPATFMQMKDARAFYQGFNDATKARTDALHARTRELSSLPTGSSASLLTNQRILGLQQFAYYGRAGLKAAQDHALAVHQDTWNNVYRLVDDLRKQSRDWSDAASRGCAGLYGKPGWQECLDRVYNENCTGPSERAHQQVVDWIRAEEQAEREYIDQFYPWETAVWANVSEPEVQEYWLIQTKLSVETYWSEPFMTLDYWGLHAHNERCGKAETGQSASLDAPQTPVPESCPPSVRGIKLAWKLEAVSVEVNCEKVSVEASVPVNAWFSVFGQLDWSPRSGKTTMFAGPKASAKIPGTSIGGSFKDGLYLQVGKDGYVADFGMRASVSAGAGFGPFSIKGGDSMDFSFAPVFGMAR